MVKKIAQLIDHSYPELFYSVILHGSIATNEVIPYSDFDGLLIVKDGFVDSKRLNNFKNESMKLILKFDPLQHHGWIQIKESDLDNYPESYFPVSILEHSKLIYPSNDKQILELKISKSIDYKTNLIQILNQFDKRIENNWKPSNVYELKSILSQIMLIPCLYYSVINNRGIFKGESFVAVKKEFTSQEWHPIEIASSIRLGWKNEFSTFYLFLLGQSNPLLRKIIKKYAAPKIDTKTHNQLDSVFYSNLNALIQKIKINIR